MSSRNPFAPSRATLDGGTATPHRVQGDSAVWRDGRVAVLLPDAPLPRRCVKCNEPAHDPTRTRKVFWHSQWLYLLLLFNLVVFAIVAVVVRKKALIAPGLCGEHKKRRRNALVVGWVGSLSGFVTLVVSAGGSLGFWGVLLGLFVTIGSIIVGMVYGRIVYASKIDAGHVRLKGCGEPFLGSLPDFPG
jgi:hypothetical protein